MARRCRMASSSDIRVTDGHDSSHSSDTALIHFGHANCHHLGQKARYRMKSTKLRCAALISVLLTSPVAALDQPNPYGFPVARGASIPIKEGYWATSEEACQKLELMDEQRPHVGLKGLPIANKESFPTYMFQYFGPRLSNWPDGLCFVRTIKRSKASHFVASGGCGDTRKSRREDRFTSIIRVYDERRISISLAGASGIQEGKTEYFFCKSVL